MTYIDVLKSVVETKLGITFVHANLYEANFGIDTLKPENFPIFLLLTGTKIKTKLNDDAGGVPNRKVPVFGFMLTRDDSATEDFNSTKVQPLIDYMFKLTDKMIAYINLEAVTISSNGVEDYSCTATYRKFDAGLFGAAVEFDWPINDGLRVCI